MLLTNFVATRPQFETPQAEILDWLAAAHVAAGAKRERIERAIQRVACGPDKIAYRGQSIGELSSIDFETHPLYAVAHHPRGRGTEVRTRM
ncbi:MAG TPA: hypothetical protein VK427_20965, partial [Kofleriaceae bacterium]|nr:hypothetical protein [Kofleriaceae bacterium]